MISKMMKVDVLSCLAEFFGLISLGIFVTFVIGGFALYPSLFLPAIVATAFFGTISMYLENQAEKIAHTSGWRTYQHYLRLWWG